MKIMSKTKIIKKNSVKNINNERKFLSILHNPFLVNMICSFQDHENLYLVMELLLGGDMRYHINKKTIYNKKKDENQLKFMAGCALLGLSYIHENKIIHKDIKPENFVFDSKGYIHITDFGISKVYHPNNGKENSGTPGYMAPEVLFNKEHDYSVDYFSLGVCLYELMMGKRPYHGHTKKELRKDIVTRQAKIREDNVPDGFVKSDTFLDCMSFINGLIERKKEKRLGSNGFQEIKEHPWLSNLNWDDLYNKKIQPSFVPPLSDNNYDKKYCNEIEKIGDDTQKEYNSIKNNIDYNKYFENYTCINKVLMEEIISQKENNYKNNESLNENEENKNVFNIKKNINNIFKDKKLVKSFYKNNNQLLINHYGKINNIFLINKEKKSLFEKIQVNAINNKRASKNYYNDNSLSTTKINSNISTGNVISEYLPKSEVKLDKYKSHNRRIIKDENSLIHNNNFSNSVYLNSYYKNKNQFSFYKNKEQNRRLPIISKSLKKSASVDTFFNEKKYNDKNIKASKNIDRIYNPSTLYGKYFPSKSICFDNKHSYYLNNK